MKKKLIAAILMGTMALTVSPEIAMAQGKKISPVMNGTQPASAPMNESQTENSNTSTPGKIDGKIVEGVKIPQLDQVVQNEGIFKEPLELRFDVNRYYFDSISGPLKDKLMNFTQDTMVIHMIPKDYVSSEFNPEITGQMVNKYGMDPDGAIIKDFIAKLNESNEADYVQKNSQEETYLVGSKTVYKDNKLDFAVVRSLKMKENAQGELKYSILNETGRKLFHTLTAFVGSEVSTDWSRLFMDDCARVIGDMQKKIVIIELENGYFISIVKDKFIYQYYMDKNSAEVIDRNNVDNTFSSLKKVDETFRIVQ